MEQQAGLGAPSQAAPATDAMAGGGGVAKETEMGRRKEHGVGVLALQVELPLAALVAAMMRGVPRRARSRLPRAAPAGWWRTRLAAPAPEPGRPRRAAPRPKRARSAPPKKKRGRAPAKGGRRCEHCGVEETPQWRGSEMGTLCNACGVRFRANKSLERPRRKKAAAPTPAAPPAAAEGTVAEPPPAPPAPMEGTFPEPAPAPAPASDSTAAAESPISDSPPYSPDTPMWKRDAAAAAAAEEEEEYEEEEEEDDDDEEIYLVRRKRPKRAQKKKKTTTPTRLVYKSAPWPPVTSKKCSHCGCSRTPQWRNGPMGRATLCNACGVRCRQGKLYPEYRPARSPTFEASKHASSHRRVMKLREQRLQQQGGGGGGDDNDNQQHPPPPPQQHAYGNGGGGDGGLTDELRLPRLQQVKEQYPPTPLHQPLPMDSIVGAGAGGLANHPADAPPSFADLVAGGFHFLTNAPATFVAPAPGGLNDAAANFVDAGAGGLTDPATAPANFGGVNLNLNDPADAPAASFGGLDGGGGHFDDFADLDGLLDGPSASPLHPDFFK
ncbi:hypothetical protein ACP4OV_003735 [Aristida adscensionis]